MPDVTGGDIGRRIELIMKNQDKPRLNLGKKLALAVAAACVLVLPLAIGMTNQTDAPSIQVLSSWATLQVPLVGLSGDVDITARVLPEVHGNQKAAVASLRDRTQAPKDVYRAKFALGPGSYECRLLVRENTTGRIATYAIPFEVK
jgi:hypothetical protein